MGVIVLVSLAVLMKYYSIWQKQRTPHDFKEMCEELEFLRLRTSNAVSTEHDPNSESSDAVIYPRELKRGCVTLLDEIGTGEFGLVYKAKFKDVGTTYSVEVAVKSLKADTSVSSEAKQSFEREAAISAQFHHDNVVSLIGVVTTGSPWLVVIELCGRGSLRSV